MPDGPVVVPAVQGGQCVLSAYDGADPSWTRVLGPCDGGTRRVSVDGVTSATVEWSDATATVDLATGRDLGRSRAALGAEGQVVARSAEVLVTRSRRSTPANPLRWGSPTTVLTVLDARTGRPVAQVASTGRLDLLLLDGRALVVRRAEGIVRYTVGRR